MLPVERAETGTVVAVAGAANVPSDAMQRRVMVPSVVLTAVALVSCGGGDEDGGGGGFAELLDDVPATVLETDDPMLFYVDMDLVWARLDLADADADERLENLAGLGQIENYSITPQLFGNMSALVDEAREEVGFAVTEIEREVTIDAAPVSLTIAEVTATQDDIVGALESDPTWSDRLQEVGDGDGAYFDWTDGDEELATDLARRTPMREIGVGGQLAVDSDDDGSVVTRTVTSALMEATLDGDGPSVSEEGPFAVALEALGDGEVLQALGITEPLRLGDGGRELTPEQRARVMEETTLLEPYGAILLAELIDGEDTRSELLLVHDGDDAADANADIVADYLVDGISTATNQPVSGIFPGAEVTQDGPVVRIALEGDGAFQRPFQAIVQRGILLTE